MIEEILKEYYGIYPDKLEKASIGAGSDTYFVYSDVGKYVLKFPSQSGINHPEKEIAVCRFLLSRGFKVSDFIKNINGDFLSSDKSGRVFYLQKFIEGTVYPWNRAPECILFEGAALLGKMHAALSDFKEEMPVGIGEDFFKFMTPERALISYRKSLEIAEKACLDKACADLKYRIGLMENFPELNINYSALTKSVSHGDYFISQLICEKDKINAVIDFTSTCIHPVAWEITRFYVYASSECKTGEFDTKKFSHYIQNYLKYFALTRYDISMLIKVFFYQISVCDYYGQYFSSNSDNRDIYLKQAYFSTALMKTFEKNLDVFSKYLVTNIYRFN